MNTTTATRYEIDVEDVDKGTPCRCEPRPHSRKCGSDVEQVVERLADEDEVEVQAAEVGGLREAGNCRHPCFGGDRELVWRWIEHGDRRVEDAAHRRAHDTRRASNVEDRRRACRQRPIEECDELISVLPLFSLERHGVDRPSVVGAHQRPIDARVEPGVRGGGGPRREKSQTATDAHDVPNRKAVAVTPSNLGMLFGPAKVADSHLVEIERCDVEIDLSEARRSLPRVSHRARGRRRPDPTMPRESAQPSVTEAGDGAGVRSSS